MTDFGAGTNALIKELVGSALARLQLELVELSWRSGRSRATLVVVVDRQGGVTLDECGAASEALSEILDQREELFPSAYNLEVSSPGAERVLRSDQEFAEALGRRLRLTLAEGDSEVVTEGRLVAVSPDQLEIEARRPRSSRKIVLEIPRERVLRAQIVVDI